MLHLHLNRTDLHTLLILRFTTHKRTSLNLSYHLNRNISSSHGIQLHNHTNKCNNRNLNHSSNRYHNSNSSSTYRSNKIERRRPFRMSSSNLLRLSLPLLAFPRRRLKTSDKQNSHHLRSSIFPPNLEVYLRQLMRVALCWHSISLVHLIHLVMVMA